MKKITVRKLFPLLLCAVLALLLSACGGDAPDITKGDISCTISIECRNILNNMDKLNPSKKEFVPEDGWILKTTEVKCDKGDTVYDVLYAACRAYDIQIDASHTPVYDTYYVRGLHQLYEMDCGELSGWTYTVNEKQMHYGASQVQVEEGDKIEWRYTCDMGRDTGGDVSEWTEG